MSSLKTYLVFTALSMIGPCGSQATAQTNSAAPASSDLAVTYQINPAHTGAMWTAKLWPPLKIKWSVDLGAPVSYPLIANGKVYVLAGCDALGHVNLYALDGATGAADWGPVQIPEGSYCWAAAAYDNGMVFVVPDSSVPFGAGTMLAFDANDGHQIWSATLPTQYLFSSPPTALNGVVYTGGAGVGGTVYAVRETDGTVLWTAGVENGDNSSPAVTSNAVFVSYACPQSYAFNPTTGQQYWHYSGACEGGGGNTPVLYLGSLFVRDVLVSSTSNGAVLNAANGTFKSSFQSLFAPAFLGKIGVFTNLNGLAAVDLSTGAVVWTAAPNSGDSYASAPIIVDDFVYVGAASGNLMGYEATTGTHRFSIDMGAPISASDVEFFGGPAAGLGAGQGLLVVPASTRVVALSGSSLP